tara:strand:- start:55 stop:495 length:441 start_codon:yes stop_codon:yes gene_type:complete
MNTDRIGLFTDEEINKELRMGTRSHIYIETEPGMFLGTYCQFDGYPSHMFPQLEERSHDEVYSIVVRGQTRGGLVGFAATPSAPVEYQHGIGDASFLFNPTDYLESTCVNYVYVKRLDGSVLWRETRNAVPGQPMPWYNTAPEEEE